MEGLNNWAAKLIDGEPVHAFWEFSRRVFQDGHTESSQTEGFGLTVKPRMEVSGYHKASDGVKYPLFGYELHDGKKVCEKVLFERPRSHGRPALFLALYDDETGDVIPESVWNEEEVAIFSQAEE